MGKNDSLNLGRRILKMRFFETLYKTKDMQDFPEGEYYQTRLESEIIDELEVFFVREKHAYFSNTEKRRVNETTTLSPDEGFATQDEAKQRYAQQVEYRVNNGFVHLFYFDPDKQDGVGYRYMGKDV
jgi:hypothetical protein